MLGANSFPNRADSLLRRFGRTHRFDDVAIFVGLYDDVPTTFIVVVEGVFPYRRYQSSLFRTIHPQFPLIGTDCQPGFLIRQDDVRVEVDVGVFACGCLVDIQKPMTAARDERLLGATTCRNPISLLPALLDRFDLVDYAHTAIWRGEQNSVKFMSFDFRTPLKRVVSGALAWLIRKF